MSHWARFLRAAHVEFCPITATPSATSFLGYISTARIRETVPKLKVSSKRLLAAREGAPPPAQTLRLAFLDGKEATHDISKMQLRDILAEIEVENGRLEFEAMKRGKPWDWSK